MPVFDISTEGFFPCFFENQDNEDCLLSLVNAIIQPKRPFVSATLYQEGQLTAIRRENAIIYVVNCKTAQDERVELSLILGMDHSFEPFVIQTFIGMIKNTIFDNKYSMTLMFSETSHPDNKEDYKRIYKMDKKEQADSKEGDDDSFFTEQKCVMLSMDKFTYKDATSLEQLWLTFFKDPDSDLLVKHPSLPVELAKAMVFAKKKASETTAQ